MEYIQADGFSNYIFAEKTAVTVGKFDACHLGHAALAKNLTEAAEKNALRSVVFSFDPGPSEFFGVQNEPYLFTSNEKSCIFTTPPFNGIDFFVQYPFDADFSQTAPREFLRRYIIEKLNCAVLVYGGNFRFGKNAAGLVSRYREYLNKNGVELAEAPPVMSDGRIISTSLIRALLRENDFSGARAQMGRPFFLCGEVLPGQNRGAALGFPTANIQIPKNKFMPENGVYITGFAIGAKELPSVTNVGVCPTFEGSVRNTETYILDYSGDLYGKTAAVNFYRRVRGEIKFDNVSELKAQIKKDAQAARAMWNKAFPFDICNLTSLKTPLKRSSFRLADYKSNMEMLYKNSAE